MAELIVTLKGREIQRFPITQRVINIGRSQNSDLTLSNESVSRDHARLSFVNHSFFIERVSDHNTLLLNEEACLHPQTVEDGDRIQIGKYTILLSKLTGPSLTLISGEDFSSIGSTEVLSSLDINRYAQGIDEPGKASRPLEQIRLERLQSLERQLIFTKVILLISMLANVYFLL